MFGFGGGGGQTNQNNDTPQNNNMNYQNSGTGTGLGFGGFGGLGGGNISQQQQQQSQLALATAQQSLLAILETFNKMTKACHKKCVGKEYAIAELSRGEAVCIDRCTAKFTEVAKKVDQLLMQEGQRAMAEQQAAAGQ